jgi:ELP3 family radical SAM enzyme/protein acetyltransferase
MSKLRVERDFLIKEDFLREEDFQTEEIKILIGVDGAVDNIKNSLNSLYSMDKKKLIKDVIEKYELKKLPNYSQLIIATKGKLGLKRKPVRSMSGVAPVATMTKPIKCPHGRCVMCPTVSGIPQSYTGKEPASRRGKRNKFHPYLQIFNRLEQYMLLGNKPEKVELILMGGNFTSFPLKYQNWFISGALKGMNDFSKFLDYPKFINYFELDVKNDMSEERTKKLNKKFLEHFKE